MYEEGILPSAIAGATSTLPDAPSVPANLTGVPLVIVDPVAFLTRGAISCPI